VTQQGVVFGTPEYMAPETARIGVSDPRTDVYALGVIFYEMLTGTVPFAGETAVDVMLKVVSEPVMPPRVRAPGIEITSEAEHLIMKALAKDPRQRQQSMEELFQELQRCYGSVRYRRSLEVRAPQDSPIPLQRVRRPGSGPFSEPIARVTPPEFPAEGMPPGAPGPILLTRRKERRKTLPMEVPISERMTPTAGQAAVGGGGHDEWSEPATVRSDDEAWIDMDVDAPDGTGG
jgi:eukaryotic-like serine/threonine-protein kinase